MKNSILFIVITFFTFSIQSQVKEISGTVSDSNGPLPGVTVFIKNTSNGTKTDFDGKYFIKASNNDILLFTYIGYKNKEVEVGSSLQINVLLETDSSQLNEVVVVGYGSKSKKSITGSITRVSAERISKKNTKKAYHQSISNSLQGEILGVHISNNSGNVGAYPTIKIRGAGKISNGNEPLYIVDGIPIKKNNNSIIANLDPKSIDKINVYKGAKARALFGASAKSGCIVISTKKGTYEVENDEKYAEIIENKFEKVELNPLSTFSIDVDKAGYSNVRRLINAGDRVPVDAVKIEEMINYFDYQYPQPIDEHLFSINLEVSTTPWNQKTKLVKIGLQGKSYVDDELPASNLTFLIDVSGSMSNHNKLPLLKSAFKLLVNQLREKDKVSIVVYAGAAGVVLAPTSGSEKEKIINALDNLEAGGSTAGGKGIELAYSLAEKNFKNNKNNRVILATDGDFNVGASSDKDMETLIENKRKSGIYLSVLGFGMGNYKDSKLEKLADKGNGNHAYIDTIQEAQKVFGDEFGGTLYTIAKDVKIQIEFNPYQVQAYRLIGYENRLLNDEDFIDDTIDAGELGSGHTVTALYEIIPVGVKSIFIKVVSELKYSNKSNKNSYSDELFTVKFRYKKPSENESIEMIKTYKNQSEEMSTDLKFSAAVALFGMQLRKSQYDNNSKINEVIRLAEEGRGKDDKGYRAEFIRLVNSYSSTL